MAALGADAESTGMGIDVGEGGAAGRSGWAEVSVRPAHAAPPSESANHENAADGFTGPATIACTKRCGSPRRELKAAKL
jgi:hypothetical protein